MLIQKWRIQGKGTSPSPPILPKIMKKWEKSEKGKKIVSYITPSSTGLPPLRILDPPV